MSTRYVWKKYKTEYKTSYKDVESFDFLPPGGSNNNGDLAGYTGSGSITDASTGTFSLKDVSSDRVYINTPYRIYSNLSYFASLPQNSPFMVSAFGTSGGISNAWMATSYGDRILLQRFPIDTNSGSLDTSSPMQFRVFTPSGFNISSTNLLGYATSSNPQEYPNTSGGGVKGNNVYVYDGADNIDPLSVTCSKESPRPGDTVSVSVTPRSNTYGGTISYLYQYQLNGGAWVDIQTTTATSISFTVPANANALRFRARAQDDMGFTSITYVTSVDVIVERLNLWVGINSKARKGMELYVGVNGKARKVTAAYIGVNGKARRFL